MIVLILLLFLVMTTELSDFVNKFGSLNLLQMYQLVGLLELNLIPIHWKDIKNGNTILIEFPKNHR